MVVVFDDPNGSNTDFFRTLTKHRLDRDPIPFANLVSLLCLVGFLLIVLSMVRKATTRASEAVTVRVAIVPITTIDESIVQVQASS